MFEHLRFGILKTDKKIKNVRVNNYGVGMAGMLVSENKESGRVNKVVWKCIGEVCVVVAGSR